MLTNEEGIQNFRGQRLESLDRDRDERSWSWWSPPPSQEEKEKDEEEEEEAPLFYPHLLPFSCYHGILMPSVIAQRRSPSFGA